MKILDLQKTLKDILRDNPKQGSEIHRALLKLGIRVNPLQLAEVLDNMVCCNELKKVQNQTWGYFAYSLPD